ncbi:MAG: sulfatase-like hydrolase/transferase [Candidatus Brocadiia bacterium]
MDRPNFLIFMTDHQRGDTVLPEHPAIMPHVARLAEEGVTFAQTFCPAPHCCPSRATFHSGLYPSRTGVWNNICNGQALSRGLDEGVRLWSEDLAAAGYRLAWSGKWHVSTREMPADRGWHAQTHVGGHKPREHETDWETYRQLAAQPPDTARGEGQALRPGYGTYTLYGTREGRSWDEQIVEAGLAELPRLAASGQPWALFIGVNGPHDPYFVPRRYLDRYRLDDVPLPPSYADDLADKPNIYRRMRHTVWDQLSEREVREGIRHFWAYCTWLDEMFGQVLEALQATGQAERTAVLYGSDHGDYCGDHGLFAKGIPCFRGAYHVPAVVRWPAGGQAPGRRVEALASLADFAPTFLELAGVDAGRDFSGASLAPFLRGETPDGWREALFTQCNGVELYYTQRSVTTGEFKYVFNGFDFDELYDLRSDPHEMTNQAANPAYAEVVRGLARRLWQFALREGDTAINRYVTVGLAPYGPAEALREG